MPKETPLALIEAPNTERIRFRDNDRVVRRVMEAIVNIRDISAEDKCEALKALCDGMQVPARRQA